MSEPIPAVGWDVAARAVRTLGTPLWIIDGTLVDRQMRRWADLSQLGVRTFYSAKANPALPILHSARLHNVGVDATSAYDIIAAERARIPASNITFCTRHPNREDLEHAGVAGTVVAGTLRQLELWRAVGRRTLGLRVNTGIAAGFHRHVQTGAVDATGRFGVPIADAADVVRRARRSGLVLNGLHTHLGSDILRLEPYQEALDRLLELASAVGAVEWINLGGGYGIAFDDAPDFDIAAFGQSVSARNAGTGIELRAEPGASIARGAGWLVTSVVDVSSRAGVQEVTCDTSVNHLPGALLYGTQHPVTAFDAEGGPIGVVDEGVPTAIAGVLMQPGDLLGENSQLPPLRAGALLAFGLAGAYTSVRATTFNGRPLPAEAWLGADAEIVVTRPRRTARELSHDELT